MIAGTDACHCEVCGTRCEGRFDGCSEVWARGPVQVDFVRHASTRPTPDGSSARPAGDVATAATDHHADGLGEVLQSLNRLETRLNALEVTVLDGQSAVARSEVAELLEKLPRRLGQEIRTALGDRQDATVQRLDEAIARLLDVVVAVDVSSNRSQADRAPAKTPRRSRAGD
jgi:hypothetical protein